jgi:dipeptidyl aminopeptidase/acylaminoacyl peptidase
VAYPREGHGIREEKHQLDMLNRIMAWFEKYLKKT